MSRKGRAYLVQLDRRLSTQPVPVRHPAAHAFTRPALPRAFCHGSSRGRGRLREFQDFLRFQGPRPYLCVPRVFTRDVNRRPTSNSGRPGLPRAPGTSHTVRTSSRRTLLDCPLVPLLEGGVEVLRKFRDFPQPIFPPFFELVLTGSGEGAGNRGGTSEAHSWRTRQSRWGVARGGTSCRQEAMAFSTGWWSPWASARRRAGTRKCGRWRRK